MKIQTNETHTDIDSEDIGFERESAPRMSSLGRIAGSGFSWMGLNTVLVKCASLIAQIVLGRLLLDDEFGLFAVAISITAFVQVLQDAGIPHLLVQGGPKEYEKLCGPGFWLGLAFNVLAACLLAGIAPVASKIYGDPTLLPMLLVIALSLPMRAPAAILIAKLRIDLRFAAIATVNTAVAVMRHGSAILLAVLGYGAMSFVWPALFAAIFEGIALLIVTRSEPWNHAINVQKWPGLLKKSRWVMLAACTQAFAMTGDYLVLGLYISNALLGQYYFAYQLTIQVAVLLAGNVQGVMFPILARLIGEPKRFANAIVRSIQAIFLIAVPICLGIAVLAEPVELILWNGKWASAVPAIQIFAFITPIRLILPVCHTGLLAQGRFAVSALVMLLQALTLMGAAWLAVAITGDNLSGIAAWIAGCQAALNLIAGMAILWSFEVTPLRLAAACLPSWCFGVTATGAATAGRRWFLGESSPLVEIVVLGTIFAVVYILLMRILCRSHFIDLAKIVPKAGARILQVVLRLEFK